MPFVKLDCGILDSSLWAESPETRCVFVTMLAMADARGLVRATAPGLAAKSHLPIEAVRLALEKLEAPDQDSRTLLHDGRRVERVEGGYLLLNYLKYRGMRDSEARREQNLEAKKRQRESAKVSQGQPQDATSAQVEAEAEADNGTTDSSVRTDVGRVFRYWQRVMDHAQSQLSPKRERLIKARLKDSTLDELRQAIDGCKASAWHMGANDSGQRYDDIALICRDREHVEAFIRKLTEKPPPGRAAPRAVRSVTDENRASLERLERKRAERDNGGRDGGELGGDHGGAGPVRQDAGLVPGPDRRSA